MNYRYLMLLIAGFALQVLAIVGHQQDWFGGVIRALLLMPASVAVYWSVMRLTRHPAEWAPWPEPGTPEYNLRLHEVDEKVSPRAYRRAVCLAKSAIKRLRP